MERGRVSGWEGYIYWRVLLRLREGVVTPTHAPCVMVRNVRQRVYGVEPLDARVDADPSLRAGLPHPQVSQ